MPADNRAPREDRITRPDLPNLFRSEERAKDGDVDVDRSRPSPESTGTHRIEPTRSAAQKLVRQLLRVAG